MKANKIPTLFNRGGFGGSGFIGIGFIAPLLIPLVLFWVIPFLQPLYQPYRLGLYFAGLSYRRCG